MKGSPQLLVEWEPPWRAFITSVGPALSRSRGHYQLQIRSGISARVPFCSIIGHFITLVLLVWLLPVFNLHRLELNFASVQGSDATSTIFWNPGLPELQDAQGAKSGRVGRSGGDEFFHPSQIIRVNRGQRLSATVVDAPTLVLPVSQQPVANLLALSPAPPSAPPARAQREFSTESAPPPEVPADRIAPRTRYLPTSLVPLPVPVAQEIEFGNRPVKLLLPQPTPPIVSPSDIPTQGHSEKFSDASPSLAQHTETPDSGGVGTQGSSTEVILSVHPGERIGLPANGTNGSFAMSPQGSAEGGLGGQGKGSGIASGNGPGSGNLGEGPGSGPEGAGRGADPNAKGGISNGPGPGGAGAKPTTAMRIPGVSIQGGVVNVPSFGSGVGPNLSTPSTPLGPRKPLSVVVIATSRSGGAMNVYGELKGGRVYTIYIDLPQGTAVLQFADPTGRPGFEQDLTPPEPLQTYVPPDLVLSHIVVSCVIDRMGALHDPRILEAANQRSVPHVIEVLKNWRFRPVLRGNQAIDVKAILGFAINTQ